MLTNHRAIMQISPGAPAPTQESRRQIGRIRKWATVKAPINVHLQPSSWFMAPLIISCLVTNPPITHPPPPPHVRDSSKILGFQLWLWPVKNPEESLTGTGLFPSSRGMFGIFTRHTHIFLKRWSYDEDNLTIQSHQTNETVIDQWIIRGIGVSRPQISSLLLLLLLLPRRRDPRDSIVVSAVKLLIQPTELETKTNFIYICIKGEVEGGGREGHKSADSIAR